MEEGGAFSTILLPRAISAARLSPQDADLVTALVLGVLRWRLRLDYALQHLLHDPLERLPPRIRTVLRMGAYQILFLERIPTYAAIHESVALAQRYGHPGTAALVNAVLRRLAREGEPSLPEDPVEALAIRQSHPRWLVDRWVARWGMAEAERMMEANNRTPPTVLRVNTLRATPEAVRARLEAEGVRVEPGSLPESLRVASGPFGARLRLVAEGWAYPQDEAAMVAARAVDPQPGELVVDACAAPGGKSTHLAALLGNRGRVVACDVHPKKVDAIRRLVARTGATCVEAILLDARRLGEVLPERADRVLVDAPCTGLGVIRRRPEIRWRVTPDGPTRAGELQRALLRGAMRALRPGGTLVYAVCSLEPEEGLDVVQWGMASEGLEPDPFRIPWRGGVLEAPEGWVTLLPHVYGTDGFFIARLRRIP